MESCECEKPAIRIVNNYCGRCDKIIMSCHHCGDKADGIYFTYDRTAPNIPMRDKPMCAKCGVPDKRFVRGKKINVHY